MAEYKVGMTGAQKFWTFVPLTAVCAYVALLALGVVHLPIRAIVPADKSSTTIYLYTAPASVTGDCNAAPSVIVIPPPTSADIKVQFVAVDRKNYTVRFINTSPFKESGPYHPGTSYTIPVGTTSNYFPYVVSDGAMPSCKSAPQDIGIIVGH